MGTNVTVGVGDSQGMRVYSSQLATPKTNHLYIWWNSRNLCPMIFAFVEVIAYFNCVDSSFMVRL